MSTQQTKATERAQRLAAFMNDNGTGALVQLVGGQFWVVMLVSVGIKSDNAAPQDHGNSGNPNSKTNQDGAEVVRQLEQTMNHFTDERLVKESQEAWETKKMDEVS